MTDLNIVKSWPREQLESAFTQREEQLGQFKEQLDRLCNESGVLCVECDQFGNAVSGSFSTARDFTKAEIQRARRLL